jgi:hypothetical protein
MKAGPRWGESELVFTAEDGAPLYPYTLTALMRKLIRDHNEPAIPGRGRGHLRKRLPAPDTPLPPARLHDLRHVHTTTLLLARVPQMNALQRQAWDVQRSDLRFRVERAKGIEPSPRAWEAYVRSPAWSTGVRH